MRVTKRMKKAVSSLLALSLVLSYVPVPAMAEEGCTHHVHDDQCGYFEGAPCTFDHAANCQYETVVVSCAHNHGEAGCTYAAALAAVFCHPTHTEECGYVTGVDCTCGVTEGDHLAGCAYVAEVPCNVTHEGCGCREAIPESGKCNHVCTAESGCELTVNHVCAHTACDKTCGFEAAAECIFVCTECKAEEKTCTCESTDPGEHAPFCDLYVRTYEECKCVLDCAVEGLNDYCETCYFEGVEACAASGEEEDALFTVTEGDCGTGVRYAIDDVTGVLTISGSGAIAKMANATKYPWYSKRQSITKIVIESGVTTIPQYAFNTSSANSVIIPDTVTEIGKSAFYGNANLTSISIPSSVTTIGETAFKNCGNLKTVYTNCDETEWNTKLGKNAFQGTLAANEGFNYSSPPATTNYTVTITVSGNGTVSGGGMYPEGDEVTVIATPDTNYKFVHWTENGTSVSTTKIYQFTLTGDRSLTAVFEEFTPNSGACGMDVYYTFDEATGVLTISGTGAMKDYLQGEAPWYDLRAQIKSVVIENGITIVSQFGFHNCDALTSVTIPDSVTSFHTGAFSDCDALTSFTIPSQVKSMGQGVFTGCSNLTSVTISAGVEIIPANTFASTPLTSITIPASVKNIGLYAFYHCEKLTTVNYDGLEDPVMINEPYDKEEAKKVFQECNISGITVNVPAGYQSEYFCGLDVAKRGYSIAVSASPAEGGSVTGDGTYPKDASVTVTATAASGYRFTGWMEDGKVVSTDASYTFPATANRNLTAVFEAHTHNWAYTAKGATITATCDEANCPVSEGKVTITLNTPADLTYNGTAKSVTVTQSPADMFTDVPDVTYEGNCTNAGQHTASLTYGKKTATLTFTIEKATISSVTVDVTAPAAGAVPQSTVTGDTGYSGYSAAIAWTPGVEQFGFNTVYTATVTLTPDGNHQFDNGINVEDWELSNSEGILTLTRTFNATRMEKLKGVTVPEDQTLTVYCANADAVIEKLPASVTYTTETGTKTAEIQWTCTDYNPAPNAENTFNWAANSGELTGYDVNGQVTSGSVKVTNVDATPVTINANDLEIVYSGETYDVAKLFTIDENAGAASYTITEKTGEGSLAGSVLTVTKAGTFTIELNTAANDPYASGKAIAVLTVTKGSGSGSVTMEGWTYGETAKTPVPASETNGTDNVTYQYKVKDANDAAYGNEKPTKAGTYTVKATFAANDLYAETTATADFTIAKATYDMSGAKWDYTEAFAYDGMEHTVAVSGLPIGVTVGGYTGHTATTVGEYTAAVILSYDEENYNEPTIADLNWAIVNDWEPTEFTFTALNGNGYSNTDFVVTAAEGYSISTTNTADGTWAASLTKSEETAEGEVTFYLKNNATGTISQTKTLTYKLDKTNPTGKVEFVERSSWQEFVNGITFGLFYKTEVTVKAEAADTLSGVETIEYAASNKSMTLDEVEAITSWQAMPENGVSVALEDAKKFVYFVKITDKAGNVTYLSTNGAEYDTTAPVIGGIENGAVYYTTQTATVTEKNLDVVTLNGEVAGTTITLEGNKEATHTIVVKDKAGNEATVTVTMKPIASLGESIKDLTVNNATSADEAAIQTVLDAVEEVLEAENIPEDEKAALIDLQNRAKALLKVIADAAAAINTENIRNVADKNETNIKLDDKADLKKARTALEEALEEYQGNYTDQEQTVIRKEIERLTKAIETIEQTEAVIAAIKALPKSVEPDLKEETEKAIRDAKAAFDKLTDYQKSLMDKDDKDKMEKLIDSLDDYEITKGNGKKWEKGSGQSLQFTANGPVRKFKELRIDDKVVGTSNYTIQEGSTIITLKASYLQTLSTGKHTIQVVYNDGETNGEDYFRIYNSGSNPATGDNRHMMMLVGIMMTSLLCMAMMVMFAPRKKGKYER